MFSAGVSGVSSAAFSVEDSSLEASSVVSSADSFDSSAEVSVLSDDELLPASLELSTDVDSELPSCAYTGAITIAKAKPAVINVPIIFFFIKIPPFQVISFYVIWNYFFPLL